MGYSEFYYWIHSDNPALFAIILPILIVSGIFDTVIAVTTMLLLLTIVVGNQPTREWFFTSKPIVVLLMISLWVKVATTSGMWD